jgi:2-dehydropantoate 2-reductase
MRSSMLAAIERGRTPAIDFLNGEVVARGARRGVAAPINGKICEAVWAIARGEQRSSREALDRICEPEERVTAAAPPPPS